MGNVAEEVSTQHHDLDADHAATSSGAVTHAHAGANAYPNAYPNNGEHLALSTGTIAPW